LAWAMHLFTGWQEFVAEQASHGQWRKSGGPRATSGPGWLVPSRTS
jgi:hypothetical protein